MIYLVYALVAFVAVNGGLCAGLAVGLLRRGSETE